MLKVLHVFSMLCIAMLMDIAVADSQVELEINEWEVRWQGRPRDPFVDGLGRTWFCGQAGNYLAYLQPETGQMKRFEISDDTHPHNLIIDKENQVWFAGNADAYIGKLIPETGKIKRFDMPSSDLKDPHTLIFNHQGNIWFTAQWGNAIGLLDTSTGAIKYAEPTTFFARPYGIKISSKNEPWIVLLGSNLLATVDPTSFEVSVVTLPRDDARPRRLEIDHKDNIWYVDYAEGYLGRYTPSSKRFKEWPMPSGEKSRPYGTAIDRNQIIWIAETGIMPNRLVGFDTHQERFIYTTEVPSGGSIRHIYYHEPKHEFWFGVDTGYIVRAKIVD
ncbi:lyase [Alkalimarinus coralli]|uniref:Vgb family protein n=1 Tax=Alkalimarinus coralli TaxID=2935863 RepID=UPI00202AC76F|nr:lyase [Alkalimarinus coralli]